jgi:hypothetical protein
MALISSLLGSARYDAASLCGEYPGVRDSVFKAEALDHRKPLGNILFDLRHSVDFPSDPDFKARQIVAAILLRFERRYATRKQILQTMAELPALSMLQQFRDTTLDKVLGMSDDELAPNGLDVRAVRAVREVSDFLLNDRVKYYCEFPLREASPPDDPKRLEQWHANMHQEATEQEQDPVGEEHYDLNYSGADWKDDFLIKKICLKLPRGPSERNYFLTLAKENSIFAKYIGWKADDSRTFHGYSELPVELRCMVLEQAFTLHETVKIVYTSEYKETSHQAPTHEQELTDRCFEFDLKVKPRLALVPTSERQHLLHLGATTAVLRRPDRVCAEFGREVPKILYGKNTIEIEDSDRRGRFGTHRFLEFMLKLGHLGYTNKLNISFCIGVLGQNMWHLRRTAWALVTMENLTRLVINVDMTTIEGDPDFYNPDLHFIGNKALCDFKQWPLFRMLHWSPRKFDVFVPLHRALETWLRKKWAREDTDKFKFWVLDDWADPVDASGQFLNDDADVSQKIAAIVSRRSKEQELVLHWDGYDSEKEDPDNEVTET